MTILHFSHITGRATEIIDEILAQSEFQNAPKLLFAFHLVVDDIVANIVNYAYTESDDDMLDVEIESNDTELSVTFKDKGIPFNPLDVEAPDVDSDISERQLGGLGIFLVRQMMDKVEYQYENGYNVLTVRKAHVKS